MNKSLHFETCKDFPPGGREFGLTSLSFLAILKVGYFVDRCVVPLRGCGAATVTLDRAERAMVMAMAKNRVHLKIGGSAYTVLTDDAPEYVEELAEELDKEMRSIINENPSLSVTQAALRWTRQTPAKNPPLPLTICVPRSRIIWRTAPAPEWKWMWRAVRLSGSTGRSAPCVSALQRISKYAI